MFVVGTVQKVQEELRLKSSGLGDTHLHYLASRVGMNVALLVSTSTELKEGLNPILLHKFYELSEGSQPSKQIALLHLRDMGTGGHFEAVLCDGIGSLCSDHAFLRALRKVDSFDTTSR